MREKKRHLVPATPGYYFIGVTVGDEPPVTWTTPVVAWSVVEHYGGDLDSADPISFELATEAIAILDMSSGCVHIPAEQTFRTADEFKTWVLAQRAKGSKCW